MLNFHSINIGECLKEVKSSLLGLTIKQAALRLERDGPNQLEEKKPTSKWVIFLEQFKSPLVYILVIAGVFSFFLREYVDAGVIFGAVFLNTIIGFFQENKANNSLKKLREMIEQKALVSRERSKLEIDSFEVVVGDIIILEAGNKVPADARLIEAHSLKVNESVLTGESFPCSKKIDIVEKGAPLAERENMVYAGTLTVTGKGLAIVIAIGKNTEIGKISNLVSITKEEKTPLQEKLATFSKFLGIMLVGLCSLVLIIGMMRGIGFWEMFLISVSLAVAAIPEGLLVSVTFILVLGMQQILKEKALIRKLIAVETLGSTTVICSDKTGTLTEGKMSVSNIIIGEKEFEVDNLGSRQGGKEAEIVSLALQASMMCNDAVLENPDDILKKQKIIGMPTDVALFSVANQSGLNKDKLLKLEPRIDEIPFSSEIKFMATLHRWRKKNLVLYEKGAPEIIMDKSAKFYHGGKLTKLSINHRVKLDKLYENLTRKGLRVIAVAVKEMRNMKWKVGDDDWSRIDYGLTFVGFIALKDPLREGVKETIFEAKKAGIRTIIITGDHELTAATIGKEIGLNVKGEEVVTGKDLEKIDDEHLKEQVLKTNIYARVSPHHKLRIVKALLANDEVVAMTGDGINDSPALRAADIGISLGTGTDIAKETSDMVLLDDHFKVIVSAIRQGRVIFSNLRKVITYLVSDSFSEIILIVGSILLGTPLAILPAQILWINIVNDGLPHFSLAFEKGEKNIMTKKPINRKEPILSKEMKVIIFGVGILRDLIFLGLFIWMFNDGFDIKYLRTLFFAILGAKSLLTIFSIRSLKRSIFHVNLFSNPHLIGAITASFSLLFLAIYWHPLQRILGTISLSFNSWLIVFACALLSIILTEIAKFFFRNKEEVK